MIISQEEQDRILLGFKTLADKTGYKPTSKRFKDAEVAFFCGVYTVLGSKTPPIWVICLQCGRNIWETVNEIKKDGK